MIRRIRVAWEKLRGFEPGARWSVLRSELFELKGIARGVLSEVDLMKHELGSIREELARGRTWPRAVTVSVLGHVLLDETPIRREESGGYSVDPPVVVTTLIDACTVTVAPGEIQKVVFPIQQNVRRGAILWVTGPGRLQSVFSGNDSCQASSGLGVVFVVPRMMPVGISLTCDVVGVQR